MNRKCLGNHLHLILKFYGRLFPIYNHTVDTAKEQTVNPVPIVYKVHYQNRLWIIHKH
jgi:hypothetical protein